MNIYRIYHHSQEIDVRQAGSAAEALAYYTNDEIVSGGNWAGAGQHGFQGTTEKYDYDAEMITASLDELNASDSPSAMGGERLGDDGQGNELWLFRDLDRVANRFEDEDGEVVWDDDVEGWGYSSEDALD